MEDSPKQFYFNFLKIATGNLILFAVFLYALTQYVIFRILHQKKKIHPCEMIVFSHRMIRIVA